MALPVEMRRFRKNGAADQLSMFEAEIDGLAALRATQTVRVPETIAAGRTATGQSWIELEYLELEPLDDASPARGGIAARILGR